jgi:hypothetical protein
MSKARDIASAAPAPSTVSATEIGYLDGVTSAVQTQIDSKQATVSGVNDTEIGYLDGVTSAIQTQLNNRVTSVTGTAGRITSSGGTTPAIDLDTSGVTAGSYGTASAIPAITVDTYGRITSATTNAFSAGGMTSIASGSVASGGIDLSSISSSYNDLVLIVRGLSTLNGNQIRVRFNNDSAGNYTWKQWRAATLSNNFGTNEIFVTDSWNTDSTTNNYIHIYFTDYTNTSSIKYMQSVTNGGFWGTSNFANTVGQWNNTSAINRIQLQPASGSFDAGTYILYGVK